MRMRMMRMFVGVPNENVMVTEDSIKTLSRNLNLNRWILLLYFLTETCELKRNIRCSVVNVMQRIDLKGNCPYLKVPNFYFDL